MIKRLRKLIIRARLGLLTRRMIRVTRVYKRLQAREQKLLDRLSDLGPGRLIKRPSK